MVLAVLDASRPATAEDQELLRQASVRPTIIVGNKSDLAQASESQTSTAKLGESGSAPERRSNISQRLSAGSAVEENAVPEGRWRLERVMHFDRFTKGHEPADVPEGHRKLAGGNTPGPSQKSGCAPEGRGNLTRFRRPSGAQSWCGSRFRGCYPRLNLHDASGVPKCMIRSR